MLSFLFSSPEGSSQIDLGFLYVLAMFFIAKPLSVAVLSGYIDHIRGPTVGQIGLCIDMVLRAESFFFGGGARKQMWLRHDRLAMSVMVSVEVQIVTLLEVVDACVFHIAGGRSGGE